MNHLYLLAAALLAVWMTAGAAHAESYVKLDCQSIDHNHSSWHRMLRSYVNEAGMVDYARWKAEAYEELTKYLANPNKLCKRDYMTWKQPEKLVLWINMYNAATVKLIIDNSPLESIRDIGLLPLAAFREPLVEAQHLYKSTLTLNDIEHEILRGEFKEPRIHFAIVCASISCPKLLNAAYRADELETQLQKSAFDFINDPKRNRIYAKDRRMELSKIFSWFEDDFVTESRTLAQYVLQYVPSDQSELMQGKTIDIEYLDYDWNLNVQQ